jgi:hypothetical protein
MLDEQEILSSLRKSVAKALAIKKALGHYAAVWDYNKQQVVKIPAKDLPEYPDKYKQENG